MKSTGRRLRDYWTGFTKKLSGDSLIHDAEYKPTGYSYYLRGDVDVIRIGNAMIIGDAVGLASIDMGEGIGPAVQSGLLAARAIINNDEYDLEKLARFSVPSFFRKRNISLSS
jgi:flavin-dependent dehydrogenase